MPKQTWTLAGGEKHEYIDELFVTERDVPGAKGPFSIHKRRLSGGASDGVDIVEIDNGRAKCTVIPTRGMGIWRAEVKGGPVLGWRSPVAGPVNPSLVPIGEPSGLGWLDGFDEFLCRCGLASNGAPEFDERGILVWPLHGRIANRPAHRVELSFDPSDGEIVLTGVVAETRFLIQSLELTSVVRTRLGEPGLRIADTITNRSAKPAEAQLLYHINIGEPLLGPGAKVVAPVDELVPRNDHSARGVEDWDTYPDAQAGAVEEVFFLKLRGDADGHSIVLLKDARSAQGMSLGFSLRALPCFSLWKNPAASVDGYVTGLEPATNYPNIRSFESQQGRVVRLAPGAQARFDLHLQFLGTAADVANAQDRVAALQSSPPTIHRSPQPGWTP